MTDSLSEGVKKKSELIILKRRLWWRLKKEAEKRKFTNKLRDMVNCERKLVKKEHREQVRAIRIDSKKEKEIKLPKELHRYKDAKIFDKDARKTYKAGEVLGPVTVSLEHDLLDADMVLNCAVGENSAGSCS